MVDDLEGEEEKSIEITLNYFTDMTLYIKYF